MWIDFFSPQESLLVPAPLLCLGTVQGGWIHLYLVRSTGCVPFDRTAKRYPPQTVLILDFECTDRGILCLRCLYRSERTVLAHRLRLENVNIPARQTLPVRSALSTLSTGQCETMVWRSQPVDHICGGAPGYALCEARWISRPTME